MARIKGGLNAKKRHNRTLKLAKGYRGARSKQYRIAKQSVMRALASSYAGRKERKRQFRQLWIARINAAARMNGLSAMQKASRLWQNWQKQNWHNPGIVQSGNRNIGSIAAAVN